MSETKWKELSAKFAKILPMNDGSIEDGVNKGMRTCAEMSEIYEKTDWTLEQIKELKNLITETGATKNTGEGIEFLQKATKGVLCNTQIIFDILDKRIKEGKYSQSSQVNNGNVANDSDVVVNDNERERERERAKYLWTS